MSSESSSESEYSSYASEFEEADMHVNNEDKPGKYNVYGPESKQVTLGMTQTTDNEDSEADISQISHRTFKPPMGLISSKHVRKPWKTALINKTCPTMAPSQLWDGDPAKSGVWIRRVFSNLRTGGVDGLAQYIRDRTGATIQEVYGKEIQYEAMTVSARRKAEHFNEQRKEYIEYGKVNHCLAVMSYIDPNILDIVVNQHDQKIHKDPDELWNVIRTRIDGSEEAVANSLINEICTAKWPTKSSAGSSMTFIQQVESLLSKYQQIYTRLQSAPKEFHVPEAMLIGQFCTKLPHVGDIHLHIEEYKKCKSLTDLLVKIRPRAIEVDSKPPSGLTAFITTAKSQKELIESLQKQIEELKRSRSTGQGLSYERRMSKEAGAPSKDHNWCPKHGWVKSHTEATCRALKPDKKPNNIQ